MVVEVFYVCIVETCAGCGDGAVDDELGRCGVSRGRADVSGVVDEITPNCEPSSVGFCFAGFMSDYDPAVGAIAFAVFWNVVVFREDDCVGAWDAS